MKKIILSLLIGFVGIISFCNSELVYTSGNGNFYSSSSLRINAGTTSNIGPLYNKNLEPYATFCFTIKPDFVCSYFDSTFTGDNITYCFFNNSLDNIANFNVSCTNNGSNNTYIYYMSVLPLPSELFSTTCPECPEVNTGEILSGYILESEIDTNYCVGNGLCPENTGNSASWSELVINDIVHQSAPLININIPQEFDWSYTVDENEFDLGISGYNVDTDYIDGIITAQNAKPNSSDLNKIISELIPLFVPGLVVILFIRFVFKFIKKIF